MSEYKVEIDDADIRMDRWFKRHFPGFPHAMLQKHLRKGDIRLDGKKIESSQHVLFGQTIEIRCQMPELAPRMPLAKLLSSEDALMMQRAVLYRDANLLIINKPFGLAVQGGTRIAKSVDDLLDALKFDAKARPKLVHRIDKDTTGILVLARSAKAAKILTAGFADKTIEKTYMALVHKQPLPLKGTIDKPLAKCTAGEGGFEKMGVDDAGKRAITDYQVIEMLAGKFSVMQLSPLTGRTHQLRVHMAEIGCPIVGDGKYGGKLLETAMDVENKLHLHAWRI